MAPCRPDYCGKNDMNISSVPSLSRGCSNCVDRYRKKKVGYMDSACLEG